MKTIGITGGTGFVGSALKDKLLAMGYRVVIFSTRTAPGAAPAGVAYCHWNPANGAIDTAALKDLDAVVHLGGAGIADKRWTPKRKKEIMDSRVTGTRFLVEQLRLHAPQCTTLISASATGFYGPDKGGAPFTEAAPPAPDFLGDVCNRWEAEAHKAEPAMRTVILRFGIIFGRGHGAFAEFEKPMSFGILPILGNGRQVVSWMEIDDLVRLIIYALEHDRMRGVHNAVSPHPISHRQLMKTISRIKGGFRIPAPAPAFIIRLLFGELAGEVLKSCTASAQKTLDAGFTFQYPDITSAVKAILKK